MAHIEHRTLLSRPLVTVALGALLALSGCVRNTAPPRTATRSASSDFELPLLALEAAGRTVCALGYADLVQCARVDRFPRVVYDVPGTEDAVELAISTDRGCVVTGAGEVRCFALDGDVMGAARPVHGVDDAAEVALADELACARTYDERVVCWTRSRAPRPVDGLTDARSIAAAADTACALRADGRVSCWGTELDASPVPGLANAVALGAGPDGAFAVTESGGVMLFHRFGPGVYLPAIEIARVPNAVGIAVGDLGGCVRTSAGSTHCWEGESWELGRERSLEGATSVAVGDGFACGAAPYGALSCRASADAPAHLARGTGL